MGRMTDGGGWGFIFRRICGAGRRAANMVLKWHHPSTPSTPSSASSPSSRSAERLAVIGLWLHRIVHLIVNVKSARLLITVSAFSDPLLTIVPLRNTAATWACRGGRVSDDPGPSSSPSSSVSTHEVCLLTGRSVYVCWAWLCLDDSANLIVEKNGKEGNNLWCKRAQFSHTNSLRAKNAAKEDSGANTQLQNINVFISLHCRNYHAVVS